jgi:catechol 2,3-dioxygenase-like lactoylglutathione lyase family enzyme
MSTAASAPILLEAIDHFGIDVTDLEQAERFYTQTFGLTVTARRHRQVAFDFHGRSFILFERKDREPPDPTRIEQPLGQGHIAFEVSPDHFDAAKRRFAAAGVRTHPVIDWGDHDCLYFLDPDGNLLELVNRRRE